MAWTDVCKINFESACTGLINFRQQSVNKAIDQLSKDSGIPARTLRRWWHEAQVKKEESVAEIEKIIASNKKSSAKNGQDGEGAETTLNNNTKESGPSSKTKHKEVFKCVGCGRQEPEVKPADNGNGQPYGRKSKFFNICGSCKKASYKAAVVPDSGCRFVCPHCSKSHYVSWERLNKMVNKQREVENG